MKVKMLTIEEMRKRSAERDARIKANAAKMQELRNQCAKIDEEIETAKKAKDREKYDSLCSEQRSLMREIRFHLGEEIPEVAEDLEIRACLEAHIHKCNEEIGKKLNKLQAIRQEMKALFEDIADSQNKAYADLDYLRDLRGTDDGYELKCRILENKAAEQDLSYLLSVGLISRAESFYYKQVQLRETVNKEETIAAAADLIADPHSSLILAGGTPIGDTGRPGIILIG